MYLTDPVVSEPVFDYENETESYSDTFSYAVAVVTMDALLIAPFLLVLAQSFIAMKVLALIWVAALPIKATFFGRHKKFWLYTGLSMCIFLSMFVMFV